jgi:hypothetical protein
VAWFTATFLAAAVATAAWWARVPHPAVAGPVPAPDPKEYYLAVSFGATASEHLDHVALFHGARDTTPPLRAADVLFLGNSRVMLGLSRAGLRESFDRLGLSYYLLGFGHGEADLVPRFIINKFDLHPKYIVVNEDGFFGDLASAYGWRVARMSGFDARKVLFEETAHVAAVTRLHRLLPHWTKLTEPTAFVYRSRADGTWLGPPGEQRRLPIDESAAAPVRPVTPAQLEAARRFQAEMARRGSRLLLTFVPSQGGRRERAEQFARHLNVPLVSPRLAGLATFDGSHLTSDSARRFTTALTAELEPLLAPRPDHTSPAPPADRGP